MYSGSYGAPPLTNNPFIDPSHPSNRYPDLSAEPAPPRPQLLTSNPTGVQPIVYQQYQQFPPGYAQQQFQLTGQPQSQVSQVSQVPQQPSNYPYQQTPLQQTQLQQTPQPTASFQPISAFGQSLQHSSGGYGYPTRDQHQPLPPQPLPHQSLPHQPLPHQQPPPQQIPHQQVPQQPLPVQTPYNPPNPAPQVPDYAQFDPYGSISQGWGDSVTPQSRSVGSSNNNNVRYGSSQVNSGPGGVPHPRDYTRSHMREIEAWDVNTWKQLLFSCDTLTKSWESRRNELKNKLAGIQSQFRYTQYYDSTQIQRENGKIQGVS